MARQLSKETVKIHLHIYAEDLAIIDDYFCRQNVRTIGRSKAIREILHVFAMKIKRSADARPVKLDDTTIDLVGDIERADALDALDAESVE